MTPSKTLEIVKETILNNFSKVATKRGYVFSHLDVENAENLFISFKNNKLFFDFDEGYIYYTNKQGKLKKRTAGVAFTCSYKTKSGYISTKKLPVDVKDNNNVTIEEASQLMDFLTDAKENKYDPFYHEKKVKRANAAAWNHIAKNHISDPYDTK